MALCVRCVVSLLVLEKKKERKSLTAVSTERTRRSRLSVIWRRKQQPRKQPLKAGTAEILRPNGINALIRPAVAVEGMEPASALDTSRNNRFRSGPKTTSGCMHSAEINELL